MIELVKQMLIKKIFGGEAFTPFRLKQILEKLHRVNPKISDLQAHYIYLVKVADELSEKDHRILKQLLKSQTPRDDTKNVFACWVVPRLGTISPWSSKATDIAQICELKNVLRIERGIVYRIKGLEQTESNQDIERILYDPLTESFITNENSLNHIFDAQPPKKLVIYHVLEQGISALQKANEELHLNLNEIELNDLCEQFQKLNHNPTDAELMMYTQVNSEHCRHKIFNARWTINGIEQSHSLFGMIRNTFEKNPNKVLIAYKDNAAVVKGVAAQLFYPDVKSRKYQPYAELLNYVFKVETHNHPTAISPFPGAATGSGGEIRDEAATGIGAFTKAGLCGFSVSQLAISDFKQPWELDVDKPKAIASALDIMIEGPIGAAAYNNEFGRPNVCGYFRSFLMPYSFFSKSTSVYAGYHKPIMIAGGIGNIRSSAVEKKSLSENVLLVVLGGPAMAIGLGGGSASSHASGKNKEAFDFASVQRANPEMERRCQEVINVCWSLDQQNPILSIHDVGAGGLSNALPELVETANLGGVIDLKKIPSIESSMSPLEIWCNEAQERYVLAIAPEQLSLFEKIAARERCPYAVVGKAINKEQLIVQSTSDRQDPVNLPLSVLFPKEKQRSFEIKDIYKNDLFEMNHELTLAEVAKRVLQNPCVADKSFLIHIGDRTVGGLTARDQMVGPWQVPVADAGVMADDYFGYTGQALAMGERAPLALLNPEASARIAVGEAITNLVSADVQQLSDIVLSANWMAASDQTSQQLALFNAVEAIGMELCPELKINIPVGKDSLSMRTLWRENNHEVQVISPLSVIISAAASVGDIGRTLTPQLQKSSSETLLLLIDLGQGKNRLGGSVYFQVQKYLGNETPDIEPQVLINFFSAILQLKASNYLLAYHDRSDGGLFTTLCEMMFASHLSLDIDLSDLGDDEFAVLFNEELGAVVQIEKSKLEKVMQVLAKYDLSTHSHILGSIINNEIDAITIHSKNKIIFEERRTYLQRLWSETSYRIHSLRDNPECAAQEYENILDEQDPGLTSIANFNFLQISKAIKPKVAILREQGVNGQKEMAAAFTLAGFECIDVHMSDLIAGHVKLTEFNGLAACGGFSYGDVLGAGTGWAQSILLHPRVSEEFANFFNNPHTFTLGICNGCQMLSQLKEIIPGAKQWPSFQRNRSEQFEARFSLVRIPTSPSILFKDMQESIIPVVISHGEGRAVFSNNEIASELVALQYVDNYHRVTDQYPFNPNGSSSAVAGVTSEDGRVTLLMPHPERVFRTIQNSWHPETQNEFSPWFRLFLNAREWLDE